MKKALCLILGVLLVVLSFPVAALAGENDNEFTVHFSTTWYGDERQVNFVKVNSEDVESGDTKEFVTDFPITFTLIRPEEWETPIVKIVDSNGTVWRSDYAAGNPNKIDISGDEFTFTPASDDYFDVFVYWSEYEAFDCGEENFCVEIGGVENGAIEFSETYVDFITDGWNTKYAFPVETNVTLTFTPDDGYEVSCIYADGKYCNDPSEEWEKQLSELYNAEKQCYEYLISGAAEGEEYSAFAKFALRSEGIFTVCYGSSWYDEDYNLIAYVKVGEEIFKNGDVSSFKKNEPITFTIVPPDDEDIKVVAKIEDNKGNVWRSDYETGNPNKIDISGNEFTFTPTSDDNFTVYVYWNEYEAFDCGEGNYCVEYHSQGKIEFSKEPVKSISDGRRGMKYAFPVDEDLTVYIIPDENYELYSISFNGEDVYCIDPSEKWGERPLSELIYNSGKGGYEYTIEANTVPQGEQYYIETEYKMASEHVYQIEYEEWYDAEGIVPVAYVKVGNEIVDSYSMNSFVKNEPLEFTMVPPEDRKNDIPVVEIEVYDGDEETPNSIWRSDFDAGNKIDITDNKFSFTPKTDKSFVVRIWWSDFDILECGAGNYFIHTFSDGNGSYKFSKTPLRTVSHDNETKYEFPVDEEVKVTFVPNDGYKLKGVYLYGWLVYEGEELAELYNAKSGYYEYVFEIDERNEGEDLSVMALYEKKDDKLDHPIWRRQNKKDDSEKTIIIRDQSGTAKSETNPDTGAVVPSVSSSIALMAGIALILLKKRNK